MRGQEQKGLTTVPVWTIKIVSSLRDDALSPNEFKNYSTFQGICGRGNAELHTIIEKRIFLDAIPTYEHCNQ